MAIVLDITSNTSSYEKLQADIARWINRTDLGGDIPGFAVNAEARGEGQPACWWCSNHGKARANPHGCWI